MSDDLGFQRQIHPRATFLHELVPLLHAGLSMLEEGVIGLRMNQGEQRSQDVPTLPDQSDLGGIAESDARRIHIDLDGSGLARFRVELNVREAAAGDNERVAFLHDFLGRRRPEQADPPGRIGAVVRDDGLAEQRFGDWCAKLLGQEQEFMAGRQASAPGEDRDL